MLPKSPSFIDIAFAIVPTPVIVLVAPFTATAADTTFRGTHTIFYRLQKPTSEPSPKKPLPKYTEEVGNLFNEFADTNIEAIAQVATSDETILEFLFIFLSPFQARATQ
ncbi:MAG: hypothetical protein PUP91_03240 [Rhizonema sp. PD37]|nr:hypothetical protein [Rhizonema sp. PD37]